MPPPNTTYVINPKLAAPRSYWEMVDVVVNPGVIVTWTGSAYYYEEFVTGGFEQTWLIPDPRFYAWSSNRWTLDFIFTDQYSQLNGGPGVYHKPMHLGVGYNPANYRWGVIAAWTVGATNHFFDLPGGPPDYWVPPLNP